MGHPSGQPKQRRRGIAYGGEDVREARERFVDRLLRRALRAASDSRVLTHPKPAHSPKGGSRVPTGTQGRCAHSRTRPQSVVRARWFVCLFVSVERTRGQRGDGAAGARALARCVATCCTALTASQHVAPRSLCCNMWQHAALRREGRDKTTQRRAACNRQHAPAAAARASPFLRFE